MQGYIHVYTGNGKGKTTAALGLILRACGAGMRIAFIQFLKSKASSEIAALHHYLPSVLVEQFGTDRRVGAPFTEQDRLNAQKGCTHAKELVCSGNYDLVILDEINVAAAKDLIPADDVTTLCREKPSGVELVLTGRDAPQAFIDCADLVTEMSLVRHYFQRGVGARKGIEK